jgi:hypothetical protein
VNRLLSNGADVNHKDNVCNIFYIIMWCIIIYIYYNNYYIL